jgi:prepilin-type N-terminal cleavage/methylation domain-containing protein
MNAPNVLHRDARGFTLTELLITMAILGLVMAAVLGVQLTSSTMFLRGENQAEAQQAARAAMLMEEDLRMVGYGCPDLGCPTPPPAGAQQKITAASVNSITFWADTLNVSTRICGNPAGIPSCTTPAGGVAAGATTIPVADASGINVGDRIYLNNGNTWETRVVTGKAGNNLTVGALTNAYPLGVQVGRPRLIAYSYTAATRTLTKDAGDGNGAQTLATGISGLTFGYFNNLADTPISAPVSAANLTLIGRIQIQTTTVSAQAASGRSTYQINTNVRPRNL